MQIFLARNNVQAGPYTLDQLNSMLLSGEVLLDDLMWHEGMSNWQRLGDVTGNQTRYTPNTTATSHTAAHTTSTSADSADGRVSVDKLYGKSDTSRPAATEDKSDAKSRPISLGKSKPKTQSKSALSTSETIISGNPPVVLAPIMSRILALAINGLLYLLSVLPLLLALSKLNIDMEKFQNFNDFDAAYEYTVSLMQSIPDATIMASQLMMFGLFAVQLLLIVTRGQSLGKMMTGIRVVDHTTHQIPPLGRLLGLRTLLLLLIYNLVFSVTSYLGFAVIAAHYFLVAKSPENVGWHDKIAKTLVVKAADDQLKKSNKKTKLTK